MSLFAVEGRRRGSDAGPRCPPWTRPASRPGSSSTTPRPALIGDRRRRLGRHCPRCSTWPPWPWPPSRWAGRSTCSTWPSSTPRSGSSSAGRSAASRPSSTSAPTCCLEVESAKSAAYYAGWAAAEDSDELPVVASLAKSYCSEAYFHAAAENIQIHGGIGFTWEHPAHLYFKRAKIVRAALRRPDLPPRAARPAHRYLVTGPWRLLDGPAGLLHTYTTSVAAGLARPDPLCCSTHDLPRVKDGGNDVGRTFPALADRLAQESGWRVVTGTLRGAGDRRASSRRRAGWRTWSSFSSQLGGRGRAGLDRWLWPRRCAWPCVWPPATSGCEGWPALGTASDLSTWADSPSTWSPRVGGPAYPRDALPAR